MVSEAKMARVTLRVEKVETPEEKRRLKELHQARENLRFFLRNEEKLRSKYVNKFIAIKNKKVIFTADTADEMYANIQAAGENLKDLFCEYMRKEPRCYLY
jgi:ribosome-associated translation inhibitor RaiA